MDLKHSSAISIMLMCLTCFLAGCTSNKDFNQIEQYKNLPFAIDKPLPDLKNMTFKMSINGDSLGFTKVTYESNDSVIIVREETKVGMKSILYEVIEAHVGKNDLRPFLTKLSMSYDTSSSQSIVNWTLDSIIVEGDNAQRYVCQPGILDRLLTFYFYPRIISLGSDSISYEIVSPLDTVMRHVSIHIIRDPDKINLRYQGDVAKQMMELSPEIPRTIKKITFQDIPWVYDLIEQN